MCVLARYRHNMACVHYAEASEVENQNSFYARPDVLCKCYTSRRFKGQCLMMAVVKVETCCTKWCLIIKIDVVLSLYDFTKAQCVRPS